MDQTTKTVNKLKNALKLSGFTVRTEFCTLIAQKFIEERVDLNDKATFESSVTKLGSTLETKCKIDRSIEREHINQALENYFHSACDRTETVFNVINAFDFPRLRYDPERKQYCSNGPQPKLLPSPESKAQLFLDRYQTILQRTRRNFQNEINTDRLQVQLQTVDYLLTMSSVTLDSILILGSLLQVSEGKYCLEDPTGMVELDLTHAKFYGGFFVESSFVLVNGYYEDKILKVSTIILPPGEECQVSRPRFGTLNYFGGPSDMLLKNSVKLQEHMLGNRNEMMLFFSDVWLDHASVFEKLETLFDGFNDNPPIAFVFMGNFISQICGTDRVGLLKKSFKQLAELINKFDNLASYSNFVFVPGMEDPCNPHIVPRLPLPSCITEEMTKIFNRAIFTTNPCRIQYCTREITVFRGDILLKLMEGTLHKPEKETIANNLARTVISQGHLSPLSLYSLSVHWDFDYTLRLYPLPDLVVIGDKSETYQEQYKGCTIINPGSFCDNGFQFKAYTPAANTLDDCML